MSPPLRHIDVDSTLAERITAWCEANGVSVTALVEVLLEDLPDAPKRERAARASVAVTPLPERVIPHDELVQRLAADREANGPGDAGGMPVAEPARGRSLVGPSEGTREVCHVHGWVGRHRFEADNHSSCDPDGDDCIRCGGSGYVNRHSAMCSHCDGSGIEPPAVVFDETPQAPRERDKLQASEERLGPIEQGKRRRPKRTRPRAKTFAVKRITRESLRIGSLLYPPVDIERPKTRAECPTEGPCPWVGCRHHLYLDVNPETGSIKLNFPDLEPWELKHWCSVDAANLGPHTLEAAAEKMNVTRERLRQLEVKAYFVMKPLLEAKEVDGAGSDEPVGNHPEAG